MSPVDPNDLRRALGEALTAEGLSGEISAEELTLLAARQAKALPPAQRQALLRRIAADPAAAELLADLQHAEFSFDRPWGYGQRLVFVLWALSLVALVGCILWRVFDITAAPLESYPGDGLFSRYMDIADRQRSRWIGQLRDFGLAVFAGLSLALSVPVLWWATRRRRR